VPSVAISVGRPVQLPGHLLFDDNGKSLNAEAWKMTVLTISATKFYAVMAR
jgi:hypothetical protein